MRCIIIEDEPIARNILRSYIDKTPTLEVAAELHNAVDGFSFLQNNAVDLLFLDIKMPGMSGLDLLKSLPVKPKVIITSAYRNYALDAFDLDVADYLLKPFSFDRYQRAVSKAVNDPSLPSAAPSDSYSGDKPFIFIKGNKQVHKVPLDEIVYIESQRDYVKIRISDQSELLTRQTIGYYEALLPSQHFIRIHRSFIVALDKITAVEANRLFVGKMHLPVGRNYKLSLHEYLRSLLS